MTPRFVSDNKMPTRETREMTNESTQVDRNFAAFRSMLPDLLRTRAGEFALLHDEQVQAYFSTAKEGIIQGLQSFGAGNFSVQEVTDEVEDLGFYSYAGGSLLA